MLFFFFRGLNQMEARVPLAQLVASFSFFSGKGSDSTKSSSKKRRPFLSHGWASEVPELDNLNLDFSCSWT